MNPRIEIDLEQLKCPLTDMLYFEPVATQCGHVFEKNALEAYQVEGVCVCPRCAVPISGITDVLTGVKKTLDDLMLVFPALTNDRYVPPLRLNHLKRLIDQKQEKYTNLLALIPHYDALPEYPNTLHHALRLFVNRGVSDIHDAIDSFSCAIQLSPRDANLYFYRACARRYFKDYHGAINDIYTSLSLQKSSYALLTLGLLHGDLGDQHGFSELSKQAYNMESSYTFHLYSLVLTKLMMNKACNIDGEMALLTNANPRIPDYQIHVAKLPDFNGVLQLTPEPQSHLDLNSLACHLTKQLFAEPVAGNCGHMMEKALAASVGHCPICHKKLTWVSDVLDDVKSFIDDITQSHPYLAAQRNQVVAEQSPPYSSSDADLLSDELFILSEKLLAIEERTSPAEGSLLSPGLFSPRPKPAAASSVNTPSSECEAKGSDSSEHAPTRQRKR